MTAAVRVYNMTNRTTLLVIGAVLSLTLGSRPSTLQAQQPKPTLTPAQQQQIQDMLRPIELPKPPFAPTEYPRSPITPPNYPPPRPSAWLEFLKNNDYLAPYIFVAAVGLALLALMIIWGLIVGVFIVVGNIVLWLILGLVHAFCWVSTAWRGRYVA
jgi:hypothetical protein